MVVRHERGLAHLGVGALGEQAAGAQSLPQRRLGHAVKVQVVLADELVDPSVVGAPEVAPARARHPLLVVDRNGERDGRPQRFGPAPHREPLHAVDDGSAHAPFYVAGDAEGHERLRGAEAQAGRGQRVAGPIGARRWRRTLSRRIACCPRRDGTRGAAARRAMASYSSKCSFFTKITGGARNSAMALVTTGRTSSSASSSRT